MLKAVVIMILFFLIIYLSLFLTGRDKRVYSVLSPDSTIIVNQKPVKITQLGLDYQPQMYISLSTPSPELLWTWYEVVLREDEVDIVYYQNWENEINPNAVIHRLYWLFRAAYYGYPTYDIEFFQVSVSLKTGDVTQLLFETSPGNNYYVTISEHIIARYKRQDDVDFQRILLSRDNDTILNESIEVVKLAGNHPLVLAQTWNHLSALISTPTADLKPLSSSLKYLSDHDYSSLKFVRKSQGDHTTKENRLSIFIASFGMFILVILPAAVIKLIASRKNRRSSR